MGNGLRLVSVNDANLEEYLRLFRTLFPFDAHTTDAAKVTGYQRWLVCDDVAAFGICGLYGLKGCAGDIWMDWFGLLPERRGQGFGRASLCYMQSKAVSLGASRFLVWTTDRELEGTPLAGFYEASGFIQTRWPLVYNQSPVSTFHKELGRACAAPVTALDPALWLH